MSAHLQVPPSAAAMPTRRRSIAGLLATAGALLAGCSQNSPYLSSTPPPQSAQAPPGATIGTGTVKAALILPLSAAGNAGVAGQAMRNAAEMAIAEFNAPNIQFLVKDDGGTAEAARIGAQQALDEGAEIILGPLFAQSVSFVGQVARTRNVPVIAFSTDANVAARGVYLLSFLPESDVERIVQYAVSSGKRSFAALIPDNPYGTVVEAAFKQAVARRNGQVVALERYPHDKAGMATPVRNVAQAAVRADALFIPDGGDAVPDVVADAGRRRRQHQAAAAPRHRPVGRSAHLCHCGARRRLVRGARRRRLPKFRRALPRPLQAGPGAHRDAGL